MTPTVIPRSGLRTLVQSSYKLALTPNTYLSSPKYVNTTQFYSSLYCPPIVPQRLISNRSSSELQFPRFNQSFAEPDRRSFSDQTQPLLLPEYPESFGQNHPKYDTITMVLRLVSTTIILSSTCTSPLLLPPLVDQSFPTDCLNSLKSILPLLTPRFLPIGATMHALPTFLRMIPVIPRLIMKCEQLYKLMNITVYIGCLSRLEYLGDAALGLVVTDLLRETYQNLRVGPATVRLPFHSHFPTHSTCTENKSTDCRKFNPSGYV